MILDEQNIKPITEIYYGDCIYFLLDEQKNVVYVGQSTSGIARACQHKNLVFSALFYLPCKKEELNSLEDIFIAKYKPKFNKKFNGSVYKNLQNLKKDFIIKNESELIPISFNNVNYIDINKADLIPIDKNIKNKKNIKEYSILDPLKIINICCIKQHLTKQNLADAIGISKQNFSNKLSRNDFKFSDIEKIFNVLNVKLKAFDESGNEL